MTDEYIEKEVAKIEERLRGGCRTCTDGRECEVCDEDIRQSRSAIE